MKNMKKFVALLLAMCIATSLAACGSQESETSDNLGEVSSTNPVSDDQAAADEVAKLIDAIYVQERNENTDEQCEAAKAAWDALTGAQKELVSGEFADPDYFGRDTGDASKDDPRNGDEIGENELLVVSFGTSFNDSRVADIKTLRTLCRKPIRTGRSEEHLPPRSLSIMCRLVTEKRSITSSRRLTVR